MNYGREGRPSIDDIIAYETQRFWEQRSREDRVGSRAVFFRLLNLGSE